MRSFHGGHQDVLVEDCEISYTGDDPYGLWPDSVASTEDPANCQRNIVLRRNIGRWPRQGVRRSWAARNNSVEMNFQCFVRGLLYRT